MHLRDYLWSRNPRGLASRGPYRPFDAGRYIGPHMGWASLVAGGDEYVEEAAFLVENNCTPIVRIYRSNMGAMAVPEDWYAIYQQYLDAGVRWFELYSLPNTDDAWPQYTYGGPEVDINWENPAIVEPLMDNWLDWAERLITLGGYPAFPAFAAHTTRERSAVYWQNACLQYLDAVHKTRFTWVIENGLWCATHAEVLNHYYQEPPGGPAHVARPYYQQAADEPGWHFEYPYDPILQRLDPGRTVIGGTPGAPYGDPKGLVAAGESFQQLLYHYTGSEPVPVVATSGGIAPIPSPGASPIQQDGRYPAFSRESHAEATLAMWKWIVEEGPPWFFGLTLTDEGAYYDGQGPVPAIEHMVMTPPVLKDITPPAIGVPVGALSEAEPQVILYNAEASHVTSDAIDLYPGVDDWDAGFTPLTEDDLIAELIDEPLEDGSEEWAGLDEMADHPPAASAAEETATEPVEAPEPLPDATELAAEPSTPSEPSVAAYAASAASEERAVPTSSEEHEAIPFLEAHGEVGPAQHPGLATDEYDHHWLVFGSGAEPAWFFDVGWRYWQVFRPVVTAEWEQIALVPPHESLLVTVLAPSETLDGMVAQIQAARPGVQVDPVECDVPSELAAELNWRVGMGQRQG